MEAQICPACGMEVQYPATECRCGQAIAWKNLPASKRPVYRPLDELGKQLGLVFVTPEERERWERLKTLPQVQGVATSARRKGLRGRSLTQYLLGALSRFDTGPQSDNTEHPPSIVVRTDLL